MKRMEIEEQNRAFEESLLADRRKQEERLAEEKKQQAQYTSGLTRVKQAREQALTKLNGLPAEPGPGVKAATIQVRLPNGTKLQRKFPAEATLQAVQDYTEGAVAQLLDDTTFLDDSTPDLHAPDVRPWSITSYEFVNNFPKKKFDETTLPLTLQALGLAPQGMLFLQEKNK
jgi:FAS-associated factor 2